jgi:hypothetical protein
MASEPDSVALTTSENTANDDGDDDDGGVEESDSPIVDAREQCGGTIKPIWHAESRLDDPEWCRQAEYSPGLREAFAEWEQLSDGEESFPWDDDDDDDSDGAEVVRDPN